jgi:hypothetical protein
MSLLLSQLSAGGSIKEGAAAMASVSAWNAAAGAKAEVPTNGGGGWSGRPVLRRRGKVKSAYAELKISSDWSASASPIRGVGMSIEEAMLILSLID